MKWRGSEILHVEIPSKVWFMSSILIICSEKGEGRGGERFEWDRSWNRSLEDHNYREVWMEREAINSLNLEEERRNNLRVIKISTRDCLSPSAPPRPGGRSVCIYTQPTTRIDPSRQQNHLRHGHKDEICTEPGDVCTPWTRILEYWKLNYTELASKKIGLCWTFHYFRSVWGNKPRNRYYTGGVCGRKGGVPPNLIVGGKNLAWCRWICVCASAHVKIKPFRQKLHFWKCKNSEMPGENYRENLNLSKTKPGGQLGYSNMVP